MLTLVPVPSRDDAVGEVEVDASVAGSLAHNAAADVVVVADSNPEAARAVALPGVVVEVEAHNVQHVQREEQDYTSLLHTHTSVGPAAEADEGAGTTTTHEDGVEAGAASAVVVGYTGVQQAEAEEAAFRHTHTDRTSADGVADVAAELPTPDSDRDTQAEDNAHGDVECVVVEEEEDPSHAPAVPLEEGCTTGPGLPVHTADAEARTPAAGRLPFPFRSVPSLPFRSHP